MTGLTILVVISILKGSRMALTYLSTLLAIFAGISKTKASAAYGEHEAWLWIGFTHHIDRWLLFHAMSSDAQDSRDAVGIRPLLWLLSLWTICIAFGEMK